MSALTPRFRPFASGERRMEQPFQARAAKKLRKAGGWRAGRGVRGRNPRTRDRVTRHALLNARAQLRPPNEQHAPIDRAEAAAPPSPTPRTRQKPAHSTCCYSRKEAAHDLHVVSSALLRATRLSGRCGLRWRYPGIFREAADDHDEDNEDEIESS